MSNLPEVGHYHNHLDYREYLDIPDLSKRLLIAGDAQYLYQQGSLL
jgi:hypothetical protein